MGNKKSGRHSKYATITCEHHLGTDNKQYYFKNKEFVEQCKDELYQLVKYEGYSNQKACKILAEKYNLNCWNTIYRHCILNQTYKPLALSGQTLLNRFKELDKIKDELLEAIEIHKIIFKQISKKYGFTTYDISAWYNYTVNNKINITYIK